MGANVTVWSRLYMAGTEIEFSKIRIQELQVCKLFQIKHTSIEIAIHIKC